MATPAHTSDPIDVWGAVAAISAVVSVLVALAMQFIQRRRASWTFFDENGQWNGAANPEVRNGPPTLFVTLANTGDGDAFRVHLVGLGCRVWPETDVYRQWLAGARPNDKILPRISSGVSTAVVVVAEPGAWNEASIAIIWTASPTWLRGFSRRARYVKLASLAPLPPFGRDVYDEPTLRARRESLPQPEGPLLDADSQPRFPVRPGWTNPIERLRQGHRVRHHR